MSKTKGTSAFVKRAASLISITTGCIVLAGWLFNIPSFKSLFPDFGSMKFNTALCFILSGLILYLFDRPSISQTQKKIAFVFSCVVLLIGALSLSYYAFGWDIGINDLFWKLKPEDMVDRFSGKMTLVVSFNFTLLGTIFLLLGKRKYHLLIQVLLIAMIPGSLLVILNNLFGISFLTSIPLRAPTSMLTAILFLVICGGVFISPALGYVQFSFVKKIAVFFVLIILVRGTVFFAINRNNQLAADKDKWVEHNHEVLLLAEKINAQSNDIQSGARGYIITAEENFPIVLRQNADSINKIIDRLRLITKGNADQQFTIDSLEKNLRTFVASQNELVTIQRNEGFDATRKIILNGEGISSLYNVHSLVAAIEQEENQILTKHKAQNELIVQNSSRLFTLFQVIAILLMLIAFRIIYNHVRLRNKIEEALKISLKETSDYKYALNESSIVDITDQKGIIRQVNDNFCKISKYEREELIGQDHRLANANWHSKEFIENLWGRIANGHVWRGEIKNKAKDGTYYWMDTTIIPFLNESGKPYQYIAIRSDITQRKNLANEILQMNDRLQIMVEEKTREIIEKEQQSRFLLQNMREGIHLIGFDWKYLFVNSSAAEHGKYGGGEILGHTIMEKYPGIEKTNLFNILQNCMKNRYSEVVENEIVFPDGTKRWLELSIQPVPEGLFILSMDIGERKKVEYQLRESEHLLNDSQQVSKIGSYVLDFSKGLWKASRELDNIFGLTSDSEHTVEDWLSVIHPDDRVMMQQYFNNEVIAKKQRFDKEYKIINKKTKKERSMHGIGDLEFDAGGTIVRMLGTIQDITERKTLEKELSEQKLKEQKHINEITIQTQEKERKDLGRELHDNVNQILATVKMYLGMLNAGDYSTTDNLLEKSYEYVDEAMKEIRKLSHSLVAPSLGNLGLKEALQLLANDTSLLNGLKVELSIDEKYNEKGMDKTKELMLYRVVQEQLANITKYAKAEEAFITLKKENTTLFLTITDNGVGFDTSQKSNGGIGLINMKSRIEFYSGNLNIISAPNQGCTIEISIPSSTEY